jgi:hypothetical protein
LSERAGNQTDNDPNVDVRIEKIDRDRWRCAMGFALNVSGLLLASLQFDRVLAAGGAIAPTAIRPTV